MNKSLITNVLALAVTAVAWFTDNSILWAVGLFSLSGAITNWLAVHMLFEKVPGLYGSGVIPARFEEFKLGIRELIMTQFFTDENIDRFLSEKDGEAMHVNLAPVISQVDLNPAFDSLLQVINESSFGGMLNMFGGTDALQPLRQPFLEKMRESLIDISQSHEFTNILRNELEQPNVMTGLRDKVENIIELRLNELTPKLVKDIVQTMIRKHLGWLVVWGGVFGAIIGFAASFIQF